MTMSKAQETRRKRGDAEQLSGGQGNGELLTDGCCPSCRMESNFLELTRTAGTDKPSVGFGVVKSGYDEGEGTCTSDECDEILGELDGCTPPSPGE